jgi:hypothetical protein
MALTKVIGGGLGKVASSDLDGAVTINESSADVDFRVESNGNANMLFVDGGNDRVGIGTSSPIGELNIDGRIVVDDGARSNPTGDASLVIDYQTTSDIQGRIRSRDWDGSTWKNLTVEANNFIIKNDAELMRINSSGNVGIGTSSPTHALTVQYNAGTTTAKFQNTNTSGTSIDSATLTLLSASRDAGINITSNSSRVSALNFGDEINPARGRIIYDNADDSLEIQTAALQRVNISNDGDISFYEDTGSTPKFIWDSSAESLTVDGVVTVDRIINATTSADPWLKGVNGSNTETFFLKPSGQAYFGSNVGIGTSSPSELIHANGSAVSALKLTTDTYTNGTVFKVQGDGSSYIYNTENAMLRFGTNNLERIRITSGGNVGIGTTSPSRKLSIYDATNPYMALYDGSSGTTISDGFQVQFASSNTYLWNYENGFTAFGTNATERMRIDANGNVGIGTSSPATYGKLAIQVDGTTSPTTADNVKGSSVNLYAATNGGSTDNTVGIFGWQASQPGLGSGIGFSRENSGSWGTQIRFYTHPTTTSNISDITERMRITSSGRAVFYQTTSSVTQRYDTSSYASMYVSRFAMSMIGNQSYTITFGGFTNGMYHFNCFASHWNGGYGLYRNSYMGMQSSAAFTEFNLHNQSSGNQGTFSFTNPSSAKIAVVKSAGTYVGGMTAIIEIKGPALLNIDSVA